MIELLEDLGGFTIGEKAGRLRQLATAGLPVPAAVVIPAETDDADLDDAARKIAARFVGERLAVRSSGVAEDLESASFAGQYETVLNVPAQPAAIAEAARRVRASAAASGVATYAGAHTTAMAVLIMAMVPADAAGVAFTRDPMSGERCVVVEAVQGLGDQLASGEAVGERWRVGDSADRLNNLGVLTPQQADQVAELAKRCEQALGSPQDIEWAISGDDVVLLQSRPITGLDDIEPVPIDDEIPPGPWEWDSTHNRLPMTPLTAAVFVPGFERASRRMAETYGAPISHLAMRTINGYLYIQVVPPAGKAGAPPPPKPVMRALFHVVPLLRRRKRAARRVLQERVDRQLLAEWRNAIRPETEQILDRWFDTDLSLLNNDALSDHIAQAVELQRETFSWNMNTDPAYLLPLSALHDFVQTELNVGMEVTVALLAGASPSDYLASSTALSGALPEDVRDAVASGGGVAALDPESAAIYETHRRAHGTKIIGFDLSNHTYLEDPDRELARIATMAPPRDPSIDAAARAADLRASLDAERAARFDLLLAEARDTYPIREEGEAVHARVMGMVRLFSLEAADRMVNAGHLTDREHVWFLTLDELVMWLGSSTDLTTTVRERRAQHLWAAGRSPEPFLGEQAPIPPIDIFPPDVQHIMAMVQLVITHDARPADLADGVDGVAASPGVYTGPARLVASPQDFDKVQPGDVLVAPLTTSPWEVLFPHIGALVTEGGGLLSHPAIVAREYALPAVVGCEGAMSRFHDGQLVRVDGAAGTVTPVNAA
jgi:rifampicin phosphotransferase